jgi:hypothetical protein
MYNYEQKTKKKKEKSWFQTSQIIWNMLRIVTTQTTKLIFQYFPKYHPYQLILKPVLQSLGSVSPSKSFWIVRVSKQWSCLTLMSTDTWSFQDLIFFFWEGGSTGVWTPHACQANKNPTTSVTHPVLLPRPALPKSSYLCQMNSWD